MLRINKKSMWLFGILIFIWINSGSVIQAIYSSELQKILCVVGALLLVNDIYRDRNKSITLPKNLTGIFIFCLGVFSVVCMILWGEYSQILLYFANFAVFYICYRITVYVDEKMFIQTFINVITVFATISIIGWLFTDVILNTGLGIHLTRYMDYRSFLIFNIITTAPNRNSGAFWEPGMYQGFLNFALLILATQTHIKKTDYIRAAIIVWAIITTYSTTGYLVLMCIAVLYLYKRIHNKFDKFADVVLIIFLLFLAFGGGSYFVQLLTPILPKDILWKIETQNISYTTRVYSVLYDIILSIRNPFGVGRLQVNNELSQMIMQYGYDINARTSAISTAFLNFGFAFGLYYLFLWVVGCFRFSKSDFGIFVLVLISMLMILNSEPMLFHMFFSCIMFYWLAERKTKKE